MAVTVEEKFGRRHSGRSSERVFIIRGTTSVTTAFDALIAEAPSSIDGRVLDQNASDIDEVENVGFIGVARYARPEFAPITAIDEEREAFQASARQLHVTHALSHVESYAPPDETAPDHDGAINVTKDGVEGVDVNRGNLTLSITHRMATADLSASWQANVADAMDGTYNSGTFRGYAAGSLQLTQVTVPSHGDSDTAVDVEFVFAISPNVTGLTVGTITGIDKLGWDYLWVEYEDADDGNGHLKKKPKAAYVERVYSPFDYTTLGLPAT